MCLASLTMLCLKREEWWVKKPFSRTPFTAIAPQKSSVTQFTSDTHQSRLHPQVRIGDEVAPLNRSPKILFVTLDTHFTFGPHARDCIERASRALNVMKALAESSWGFTIETLVAT